MLADYHVHTRYSDDSEYLMEDVVKDAIALGLEEICFTDHVDYGVKCDWDDPRGLTYRRDGPGEPEHMALANVDYPRYAAETAVLKEKYKDQITIKMGMEFGMQAHTIPQYKKLFRPSPLISLSCLCIRWRTGNFGRMISSGAAPRSNTTCGITKSCLHWFSNITASACLATWT